MNEMCESQVRFSSRKTRKYFMVDVQKKLSTLSFKVGALLGRRSVNNTIMLFDGFRIIFYLFA